MDLELNNPQSLIWHKPKQPTLAKNIGKTMQPSA